MGEFLVFSNRIFSVNSWILCSCTIFNHTRVQYMHCDFYCHKRQSGSVTRMVTRCLAGLLQRGICRGTSKHRGDANESRSVCQEACLTNEVVQQIEGSTDPGPEGQ